MEDVDAFDEPTPDILGGFVVVKLRLGLTDVGVVAARDELSPVELDGLGLID